MYSHGETKLYYRDMYPRECVLLTRLLRVQCFNCISKMYCMYSHDLVVRDDVKLI